MGTESTTTPKMKLTFTIILALAAFASAQLDGQESTEDLIHMLADDANPTEADALVETDADASAVSRLYVGKECANTHEWHIEEDCQSARGHCWVRVADFSSKFGSCRRFCASQGKGCVDGQEEKEVGGKDTCYPDGITSWGNVPCDYTGRDSSDALCRCTADKPHKPMVLKMAKWWCGKAHGRKGGPGNCSENSCKFQCNSERGKGWCKKYKWDAGSKVCTLLP